MLQKVGTKIHKNSKQGGGEYCVIGHINCPRNGCKTIIELREILYPSKSQRKVGHYFSQYSWCHVCGLYEGTNKIKIN